VQCGMGLYVPSVSTCTCTASKWDCALPAAGEIQCPNPVVGADFYIDPSCLVRYGGDAGTVAVPETGPSDAGVDEAAETSSDGGDG
jgi:hypothetical protein